MLRDADALLVKARAVILDAAGLVLCDDRALARTTAALLRTIAGAKPVVVVSDEVGAHARIERFARGGADAPRWIVAVNMVSEGIDIPRLVLAAYATVKRTDLFFRQAVGRIVRRREQDPEDLVATVFLPADQALKGCAERVEVQLRQQVSEEAGQAFDVEPPAGTRHRADFQALDAEVAPGGMIVAGVHYRRDEVDAARRLLRELGQPERALRSVLEFVRRERVGGEQQAAAAPMPGSVAPTTAVPAHRRVEDKRRALDRLARRWAKLRHAIDPDCTWPQAQARVNRAMGVARRTEAGERALDDGLAFLRSELGKLAAAYPEQAESLRIPGSVEAIDEAWRRRCADAECGLRRGAVALARPSDDGWYVSDLSDTLGSMTRMTATQAARSFSEVLNRVASGETVEVTRSGAPVAVIGPPRARLLSAQRFRTLIETAPRPDDALADELRWLRDSVGPPREPWPS